MKNHFVIFFAVIGCIFANDSGPPNQCSTTEPESSDHLVLNFNPKTKIHVTFNKTALTVPVLDYMYNISALYNGKTGAALVFNYESGISAFIPPGSDITWYSERSCFEDYFENLQTQKNLFEYAETHGIRFDPTSITEEISDEIVNILAPMSQDYRSRCEALANFLHISKITGDYLKTSMSAFSSVAGLFSSPYRGDFRWLIGIYQGIGGFFDEIEGGMTTLDKNNVTVDMEKILTQKSGFHVLIYFLEDLHKKFDIGNILGKALNAQDRFFTLVDKLSGEIDYGFDGYIHVVAEIVKYKFNESSIQNVENILTKYGNNPKTESSDVKDNWKVYIQDLLETIKELDLEQSLKDLVKLLTDILNDNWKLYHTDMSQVLDLVMNIEPPVNKNLTEEILELIKGDKEDISKEHV